MFKVNTNANEKQSVLERNLTNQVIQMYNIIKYIRLNKLIIISINSKEYRKFRILRQLLRILGQLLRILGQFTDIDAIVSDIEAINIIYVYKVIYINYELNQLSIDVSNRFV